ncbi:MAG: PLP-dependent aminotransferase family protein [Tepidisphaeraceae bacterium]
MLEPTAPKTLGRAGRPTVGDLVMKMSEAVGRPDMIPLGHAVPSPDSLPTRQLNRFAAAIARTSGRGMATYDIPPGCLELRVQVARHYLDAGCTLSPDELVTTCGCQEALGLCLRAVTRPGSVVAVDTPSYYGQLQTIELLGLRALEIPTHPQTGVDLQALQRAIRSKKIAACLFTPNCHNPLGFIMPEANKRQLVELLARHDLPLIEDDIYGDLAFAAQRPTVCRAFDRDGRVLLCSSFSKTLAPGARVGWCAPGRYLDDVMRLKFCNTIATPTIPQLAIAEFLAVGGYAHHLRKLRKRYAEQVQFVSHAVQEFFPGGTRASRPAGGHVLWVELPAGVDSVKLFERAIAARISLAPGTLFSAGRGYRNFIRLNCSHAMTPTLRRAIQTVGELAAQLCDEPPAR